MNDTQPLEPLPEVDDPAPRSAGVIRPILIGVGSGIAVLALGVGGVALADELRQTTQTALVIESSSSSDVTDDNPSPSDLLDGRGSSVDDSPSGSPSSSPSDDSTHDGSHDVGDDHGGDSDDSDDPSDDSSEDSSDDSSGRSDDSGHGSDD